MEARPYPWETLPRLGREQASLLRRLARRLPLAAPQAALAVLREALGAEPLLRELPLGFVAPGAMAGSLADPLVAVVLAAPEGPAAGRVAIELDPRIAACIIDRALGGDAGAEVAEPVGALGDVERGVLAYVAARAVTVAGGRPWRVLGVVTSPAALLFALKDDGAVVWSAEVCLGTDRGMARAWIPEAALSRAATDVVPGGPSVRRLPVELVAEGARGELAAADLEALRSGDVVVLDETWLALRDGTFSGEVRLRAEGATRTAWWCAVGDEGIVVREMDRRRDAAKTRGSRMQDTEEREATDRAVDLAGDAPVEVTVEVARFTLPLEELGSLRVGEVVLTGRALGERVILRAGGRAVAEGELVDVEGEVGVRLMAMER